MHKGVLMLASGSFLIYTYYLGCLKRVNIKESQFIESTLYYKQLQAGYKSLFKSPNKMYMKEISNLLQKHENLREFASKNQAKKMQIFYDNDKFLKNKNESRLCYGISLRHKKILSEDEDKTNDQPPSLDSQTNKSKLAAIDSLLTDLKFKKTILKEGSIIETRLLKRNKHSEWLSRLKIYPKLQDLIKHKYYPEMEDTEDCTERIPIIEEFGDRQIRYMMPIHKEKSKRQFYPESIFPVPQYFPALFKKFRLDVIHRQNQIHKIHQNASK